MRNGIDHDKRIREILSKSLKLCAQFGYANLTYKQISERCGVNRTAIYNYFPNKRAIFDAALQQLIGDLAEDFQRILASHPQMDVVEKLVLVVNQTISVLCSNSQLLQVISEYLLTQRRQGEDVTRKALRHTWMVRKTIRHYAREAIQTGTFKPEEPKLVADTIFGVLESTFLRVALSDTADQQELTNIARTIIDNFRA